MLRKGKYRVKSPGQGPERASVPEDTQLVSAELGMESSWFSSRIAAHFLVTTPLNPRALGLPLMETPSGSSETLFSEHICKNPKETLSLGCFQLTYWSAPVGKLPRTPWLYTQLLLEKELRNKGGLMPVGCADQPRQLAQVHSQGEEPSMSHTSLCRPCFFCVGPWVAHSALRAPESAILDSGGSDRIWLSLPSFVLCSQGAGLEGAGLGWCQGLVPQSGLSLGLQGVVQMALFSSAGAIRS